MTKFRAWLFIAIVLSIVTFITSFLLLPDTIDPHTFGAKDFIQYYAAHKAIELGLNPYSTAVMFEIQQDLGFKGLFPVMMWNPPWLINFFSPIFSLSFESAVRTWCVLQTFSILLAFLIACYQIKPKLYALWLAISLMSIPIFQTLKVGQMSGFFAFTSVLLVLLLQKRFYFSSGLILSLFSYKPHLFYLLFLLLLIWSIRKSCYELAFGATCGGGVLFFLGLPNWQNWIEAITSQSQNIPTVYNWIGPTLPSVIRYYLSPLLSTFINYNSLAPQLIIPPLVSLIFLLAIRKQDLVVEKWFWGTLGISVCCASYGWSFDLLLGFGAGLSLYTKKISSLIAGLLLSVLSVYLCLTVQYEHQFWPLMFALLIISYYSLARARDRDSHEKL